MSHENYERTSTGLTNGLQKSNVALAASKREEAHQMQ